MGQLARVSKSENYSKSHLEKNRYYATTDEHASCAYNYQNLIN